MDTLKILLLEDVEFDAELAMRTIKNADFNHSHVRVDNLDDFQREYEKNHPDIIISDYNLPSCNALDAYKLVDDDTPFIILSGAIGEEKAVEALKLGVTDYVSKESMSRLPFVIDKANAERRVKEEKTRAELELVQNKERLELALTGAELGTWDWDIKSNKLIYDDRAADIFDHPRSDTEEDLKSIVSKVHQDSLLEGIRALKAHHMGKSPFFECELRIEAPHYTWRWVLVKGKINLHDSNQDQLRASGTIQDIDDRKTQEERLLRSQQLLHEAHQIAKIGSFEWTLQEGFTHSSEVFHEIFEVSKRDLLNHRDFYFNHVLPEDKDFVLSVFFKTNMGRRDFDIEHRILLKNEKIKAIRSKGQVAFNDKEQISRVVGTVIDITEQQETKKALYRGQELERQRVAREIHDGIGQMLIATKYKVSSLNEIIENGQENPITEVEEFLDNVIEETRRISRNLSNKLIDDFGLIKASALLIDELSKLSAISIRFEPGKVDNLNNELSVTIYRIIQEAITNALKYANATEIIVSMEKIKMSVLLKITDNGSGFNKDLLTKTKGSGLKNMQDRTSALDGHFELITSEGQGTQIISWLPFSN